MEVIDLILRDAEARGTGLSDQEVDLCSEILKILFNLTVTVDRNNFDEVRPEFFLLVDLWDFFSDLGLGEGKNSQEQTVKLVR